MQTKTVLLIIVAALVALLVVFFQYYYSSKKKGKTVILLSILRFLGIFGLLILLINPKFSKTTYSLERPSLAVLVDNSSSIAKDSALIKNMLLEIADSKELNNRFDISSYSFGTDLRLMDSLSFQDNQTNIKKTLDVLSEVYARKNTAVLFISDGNQTIGEDYSFFKSKKNLKVYPITVGDTTKYEDLSVGPINTNKYAFLDNKFPLETYVSYQGVGNVVANVTISLNNKLIYTEQLTFTRTSNLKSISTLIKADGVGKKELKVSVSKLTSERNTSNNSRETTIEIIDEKTKIALVSEIVHPDLGALKKAIEKNEQRTVQIINPSKITANIEDIDLFICYQPTAAFSSIFELVEKKNSNLFIITGIHTDFDYLNSVQSNFQIESGYPSQEVFGSLNKGFSKYDIADFVFTDFPPLNSDAGPLTLNTQSETLLGSSIKGLDLNTPLFSLLEVKNRKQALLLGEGIWKWRMQSFRNSGSFDNFDSFLGKLLRFLTNTGTKDRLNVDYNTIYEGNSMAYISATFFDEAYVFKPNAQLNITILNTDNQNSNNMPMLLKNEYYEADLTNLLPGNYSFIIKVKDEGFSESGTFTISNFDIEKQFVSSDDIKMKLLAQNTGGLHFYSSEYEALITAFNSTNGFVPTQKGTENVVSLIDFRILLALIAAAFAAEWFIRKYNGLI